MVKEPWEKVMAQAQDSRLSNNFAAGRRSVLPTRVSRDSTALEAEPVMSQASVERVLRVWTKEGVPVKPGTLYSLYHRMSRNRRMNSASKCWCRCATRCKPACITGAWANGFSLHCAPRVYGRSAAAYE